MVKATSNSPSPSTDSTPVRVSVVPTFKSAPKRLSPIKVEKEALRPKSAHFGRNLTFARRRGARRKVVPEKRKMRPSSSGGFRQAFAGIPSPHQRLRGRGGDEQAQQQQQLLRRRRQHRVNEEEEQVEEEVVVLAGEEQEMEEEQSVVVERSPSIPRERTLTHLSRRPSTRQPSAKLLTPG